MKRVFVFSAIMAIIAISPVSARIIYVPQDYSTIQQGIDESTDGDTVLVAAGHYPENVMVDKAICLFGQSEDSTIIDASLAGSAIDIVVNDAHLARLCTTNSGAEFHDAGIQISFADFCIVEYCRSYDNNAGLFLHQSSDNTIAQCRFYSNTYGILFDATDEGIAENNARNQILNNIISQNDSSGIHFQHLGSLTYHLFNFIIGNRIEANNQGMYMIMSHTNEVTGNYIANNAWYGICMLACMGGGELNLFHHNNFMSNNIDSAQALNYGSINYWYAEGDMIGNHWDNYAGIDTNGDGIGDTPYILNGDGSQDIYPKVEPFYARVAGIVRDYYSFPLEFVYVTAQGTGIGDTTDANGAYLLNGLGAGMYDIAFSRAGYFDTTVTDAPTTLDMTTDLNVQMHSITAADDKNVNTPIDYMLLSNYPNPFNGETVIRFNIQNNTGPISIKVYNLAGQLVSILYDGDVNAGHHEVIWNGTDRESKAVSSGIYFYTLETPSGSLSRRMVLLK